MCVEKRTCHALTRLTWIKRQKYERVAVRCHCTLKKCVRERDEEKSGGCLCAGELEQVEFIAINFSSSFDATGEEAQPVPHLLLH